MEPKRILPEIYKMGADKHAHEFHLLFPSITPSHLENLRKRSANAKMHAYCPYSNFRVGASLLTADGANIENSSYPVGICAERVALGKAVFAMSFNGARVDEVDRSKRFIALGITTDEDTSVSPCGMCRQFLREFCRPDMPIMLFNKDGDFTVLSIEQAGIMK
ncbi:Cytidine deaminase [Erysiphe neolycopersici]|uniref:Cytidine deaminase n=1 Tax=Erysiphe neolycopersici TaxID=212602 RepID=A0A420I6P7_9PEZI|nr:Cytidine deaminase [Erysiphe neolycopersici]